MAPLSALVLLLSLVATALCYTNPVLWEDLADIDILRVGDAYYYSASTMHYSPGAPVLRSYDLVNWDYIGHSVPRLDFDSPAYDLPAGQNAYVKGIWASFLGHRASTGTFVWGGCVESNRTYLYTAPAAAGPWSKAATLPTCYYDAGLLVDDDDDETIYVAHGASTISVAQLSADGLREVRKQAVFTTSVYIEGSRFYKAFGNYYILVTRPANAEFVLRSTAGVWGPYEMQPLLDDIATPVPGTGVPHQGGLVSTPAGDWHYLAFIDAYPGGRMPVLAPITWADGWPVLTTVNGGWNASYADPLPLRPVAAAGVERFTAAALGPAWEWNHNPDNTRWRAGSGLVLQTASVAAHLHAARNTLTRRIRGPVSTATIRLDYAGLADGDRAGLALLRDSSAWIGVMRDGAATRVAVLTGLTMDSAWATTSVGSVVANATVPAGGEVWLRVVGDITPNAGSGVFSYSLDGETWTQLGGTWVMKNDWHFFMGYRFGVFNYATKALGGRVTVGEFEMTQ
ncbi:glycosyl hydrolase [Geopyxis carbonaria]|nr:glycosyl hydrolase [Geopyxis carbonaria]